MFLDPIEFVLVRTISRMTDEGVVIYDANAEPLATVPVPAGTEGHAVPPGRDRVIAVTGSAVVCVALDGGELWRFPIEEPGNPGNAFSSCAHAPGEQLIWVYVPGPMACRDGGDRWFALDTAAGELRFDHRLPTSGHGATVRAVEPTGDMLLEIGEGQDGLPMFRTGRDGTLHRYEFDSRSLTAVAPDGTAFMTVDHEQQDVAFHAFPSGKVVALYTLADVGLDPEEDEVWFNWAGGYLSQNAAVVVVGGGTITGLADETDEAGDEWWRHLRLDLGTGEVADMSIVTIDPYDIEPLGDGTYLITDTDGTLRRL